MKNWTESIYKYYKRFYQPGGFGLVMGGVPSAGDMKHLCDMALHKLPEDIIEIYSLHNGFGIMVGSEINWILVPICDLVGFQESCKDWFAETHPCLSDKVFPFLDWGSGDFLMLMRGDVGFLPEVYEFEHESFDVDANQPWREFVKPAIKSLSELLEPA